jgi:predicted enzyme related to lactoylglutathione lyase
MNDSSTTPFKGLRTCIYHVEDLKKAVEWYSLALKKPPYFDEDFYVGFNVGGYELGLLPNEKSTSPGKNLVAYWGVEDIEATYKHLLSVGATEEEKPNDVGGGIKVAHVLDPWENILGIIYNPHFMTTPPVSLEEARVTALGGIFFKSPDPEKLKSWYEKHLGIPSEKYGTTFEWRSSAQPEKKGFTAWSIMPDTTSYFEPGKQQAMINYRVNNLEALLEKLKQQEVEIVGEPEAYDYGKFGWIMDPDGNKIELWEPVDEVYAKMEGKKITT